MMVVVDMCCAILPQIILGSKSVSSQFGGLPSSLHRLLKAAISLVLQRLRNA